MSKTDLKCRKFVRNIVDSLDITNIHNKYPCIARHFPPHVLAKYSDVPPYYCHYMLWRLSTLRNTRLERLETLLQCAEKIPGWRQEAPSLLNSRDFAEYWSLLWQLQIAEFLLSRGFDIRWGSKGPDIIASKKDGAPLFIECLCPRKQYGKLTFLEELLSQIDPRLKVTKHIFLPLQIHDESDFAIGLESIVDWLTRPGQIESLESQARRSYPVRIPSPDHWTNLTVYFEGDNPDVYQPGILPQGGGDPNEFLKVMLEEAARGKQECNGLTGHHPNVLAINLLLDDLQVGLIVGQLSTLCVDAAIDKLVWGSIGIDEVIFPDELQCYDTSSGLTQQWHP